MNDLPETLVVNGVTFVRADIKAMPDECLSQSCTYYAHYLVYHDPVINGGKLEHSSYHVAEEHCSKHQNRLMDWLDAHPDKDPDIHASNLINQAKYWEIKVCA